MRLALLVVVVLVVAAALGCAESPPKKLTLDPSGPFKLASAGASESLRITAWDEKGRPYTKPVDVTWSSSDESVAVMGPDGTLKATGSGDAVVKASVAGIEVSADVRVRIVGSVEIDPATPKEFRLNKEGHKLKVTIKDDKGSVMESHPPIEFSTSNWCIDIDPDGTFRPVSLGECDAVAKCAGKSASFKVKVVE